jgi:hypothetical protein
MTNVFQVQLTAQFLISVCFCRALSIYNDDYGPTHIKFVIEWDPEMKKRYLCTYCAILSAFITCTDATGKLERKCVFYIDVIRDVVMVLHHG